VRARAAAAAAAAAAARARARAAAARRRPAAAAAARQHMVAQRQMVALGAVLGLLVSSCYLHVAASLSSPQSSPMLVAGVADADDDSSIRRRRSDIDAADVTYRAHGAAAAAVRNVSAALDDSVSVLDFGARASCRCQQLRVSLSADCCPDDDTTAFAASLAACNNVLVPPGSYRIDGTVELVSSSRLTLSAGAILLRTNITACEDPVVRLSNWYSALTGPGHVQTVNPSPRGVVAIAPRTRDRLYNIEWNLVEGVHITGPGISRKCLARGPRPAKRCTDVALKPQLNGSIGVSFDSNEGVAWPKNHSKQGMVGGATYQNTLRDVSIQHVDIGVYIGLQVNANQVSGVMMEAIGQSACKCGESQSVLITTNPVISTHTRNSLSPPRYRSLLCMCTIDNWLLFVTDLLRGPNSENVITGGFVAGHGGNTTVIKTIATFDTIRNEWQGTW
jgi:hypothetical protein